MAGFTATDLSTYIGQLKSANATKASLYAAAASGDTTAIATAPGASLRLVVTEVVLDCDTAGETVLIEDEDGTDLLTLRMPVPDTYHWRNLNLEVTVNKGFKMDKGTTAIVRGWVVYRTIRSGEPVAGA